MFLNPQTRHIVPRWRDFRTTLALGELRNLTEPHSLSETNKDTLDRLIADWRNNPTVWHAGDLLSSAFVLGRTHDLQDVTDFVINNRKNSPRSLAALADEIRNPRPAPVIEVNPIISEESLHKSVHGIRARLREEPRNAIQWVELARLYSVVGDLERGHRAMAVAAALGPDHRFVVRSAARFFLHEKEINKALKVIRTASGAKNDPWLLASEIAVASASSSPSLLAKEGRSRNEDDSLTLFERNELSSALATLDMENGKNRKARQLFRRALEAPNENSVAQVEWANRQIGGLEIEKPELFQLPRSFEANAQLSLVQGEWRSAIAQGIAWLNDQQFSKRPALFTSYVSSLVEDHDRSIEILRTSLRANPGDPMLINNLAFALASQNNLEEAIETLDTVDPENVSGLAAVTLTATQGLVLFRLGYPDKGRELYHRSRDRAGNLGAQSYRLMADLYLAREELIAGTPGCQVIAQRALANAAESIEKDVALIAEQVSKVLEKSRSQKRAEPVRGGKRRIGG